MKKGANAWIFPKNFTVDEILKASKNIGYDGVELNVTEEMLRYDREDLKEISETAESLGLELPSLCTDLFWKYNLASPDKSIREKGIEIIRKECRIASEIGAKVILVVPAVATPETPYEETWRISKRSILEAAPTAKEHGVYIGVENVWNKFLYSPLEFKHFIEEINHPNVKAYFDVGNMLFLSFPQQWIRHLSELIVCIHLKDFENSTLQFKPLLQGDVPWPEIMKALREIGYDWYLNVEVPPYPNHPLKSAIDNKTSLDIILEMNQ